MTIKRIYYAIYMSALGGAILGFYIRELVIDSEIRINYYAAIDEKTAVQALNGRLYKKLKHRVKCNQ